ncbi:UDP-N-acetylmuramate dehydrogenase [soil metagenome]
MHIIEHQSLKAYNTFGLEAQARYFVEVTQVDELLEVLRNEHLQDLPRFILGGGSNILLTQDFDGLVIKNSIKGIEIVKDDDKHVWLKSGSGEVWHDLVMFAIEKDLGGIENLSLIPGQVGAAPMQNIGAYGVELVSVFDSLEAVDMQTGELRLFSKEECHFGYRESVFKTNLKGKYCIVSVTMRLTKKPTFNISYGDIKRTLDDMRVWEPTVKAVSDAVIKIRQSKLPDPKVLGNSGSFFKNPEIPLAQFEALQQYYPLIPNYPAPDGLVKIPAGWLIEQCGWKGKKVGYTGSHAQQALVLVNYGGATGHEIYQLALDIQASVKKKFGIDIVPEVNMV